MESFKDWNDAPEAAAISVSESSSQESLEDDAFSLISILPSGTDCNVTLTHYVATPSPSAASSNLKKPEIKNRPSRKGKIQKHCCMVAYNPDQPIPTALTTTLIQTPILNPKEVDVLCERGGRSNNHPGNKHYLKLRDEMTAQYHSAPRNAKKHISQALVDRIKKLGGRFLKSQCTKGPWSQVPNLQAREKAAQALREGKKR